MVGKLGDDQWGEKYKLNLFKELVNVDHVTLVPDEVDI
jgi:sugar/nucleoside kinase (ribokinase family)